MRRRALVILACVGALRPSPAGAQQAGRPPEIGALLDLSDGHPEAPRRIGAFRRRLEAHGWHHGRTVQIEVRWGGGDPVRTLDQATELVARRPIVVLAAGSPSVAALRRLSRDIPIVFTSVFDPVGAGFVESLARPGGNVTGFATYEPGVTGKWLELLREIAPRTRRVAVLWDPRTTAGPLQLAGIRGAAPIFGLDVAPLDLIDVDEVSRRVAVFAGEPAGGMVVTGSPAASANRDRIVGLAAQHRLPAVYAFGHFVAAGGLLSYGIDLVDSYSRAADYVDRILRGARPADLPVQGPVKYELAVNLRTARALGLVVPPSILARADEVIE